ncbi:MAG: hypothetical protein Q9191_001680 [Dirinaria sp. TL-2023a]
MDVLQILDLISFHFVRARPFIPTYLHVLFSAVFVIYTSSHASLSIPSSAAKPTKRRKQRGSDSDGEDESSLSRQKLEGLSPSDAIMFPLFAGCTLAGLYFLIKWLEDPAILNKILNWYFSMFGVFSVARLSTDAMGLGTSFIFPAKYAYDGTVWEIKPNERCAQSLSTPSERRKSPLPGFLSKLKIPSHITAKLWMLREVPSKRFHVRAYIHRILEADLQLGPHGSASFVLALAAVLYYNLVAKPWWLTNILGYSFTYTALQHMSPSTFWTGTMILSALFFYDIYFVFFTPIMVTVATKIDIPAKMLFPRPADPGQDPARSLAMLGLGDIVLPGIAIGMALRFDLYLFYLRKQKWAKPSVTLPESPSKINLTTQEPQSDNENPQPAAEEKLTKVEYRAATGSWGTRFWLFSASQSLLPPTGAVFPKPYFHASLLGYTVGMLLTLGIMQVFGHAQPALLYLVPGVLVALWGTALRRGELKQFWEFDEMSESNEDKKKESQGAEEGQAKDTDREDGIEHPKASSTKKSIFSFARQEEIVKRLQGVPEEEQGSALAGQKANKRGFYRDRKTELVFFSINLPGDVSQERAISDESKDDLRKELDKGDDRNIVDK